MKARDITRAIGKCTDEIQRLEAENVHLQEQNEELKHQVINNDLANRLLVEELDALKEVRQETENINISP